MVTTRPVLDTLYEKGAAAHNAVRRKPKYSTPIAAGGGGGIYGSLDVETQY
jgi:hypothetical protein